MIKKILDIFKARQDKQLKSDYQARQRSLKQIREASKYVR